MSDFKPTPSQKAAIEARGGAVLVSAGAGSGKTKVLTERLMGYICDEKTPVDLDSFLVITFTRAAAGELRSRISQELNERLAAEPGNRRLRRQSALCQRAQIGTIHSFCAALLREHSHLIAYSPDFKILDDERSESMKAAALERVIEERYDNIAAYPGFSLLVDTVGAGRNDSRLIKLVLNLHNKMQSHARPDLWVKSQVALLNAPAKDVAETPWGREVLDWAKGIAEYWSGEFDSLMSAMAQHERISKAYMESFSATADWLRDLCRGLAIGWDEAALRREKVFPNLGRLTKSPDPELSDKLKARRDTCKKAMTAVEAALASDSDTLLAQLKATAPAMEALLALTLDFDAAFSRDKRSRALVDYSDLEHLTAQLLTNEDGSPTALAEQLSSRYTEIMVDEYQDVSRVQDAIFKAISKQGKNLFMVGDVKQAIYRFRLADPEIFTEKYLAFGDAAKPGEPRRILLRENFRSRRETIEGINSVFSLCMSRAVGDVDYDDAAALKCGVDYPGEGPTPELLLLELPPAEDDEESPKKAAFEARLVAGRIKKLVESGATVVDRGEERPMRYSDIAILLRSPNSVGGEYRRALAEQGVPVSSIQGSGFFSSVEVSTLMSMLAVIDNPHQDIPLIAVLRSPVFGFSADQLCEIRATDKKADFYTALTAAAESDHQCRRFLESLAALREAAPDLTAAELTWQILDDMNMLALCSAMENGEQRRANLLKLVELAESFESTGVRGLHRFVLWLRKLAEKGQEPTTGAASTAGVQIMSIHKSKGLEFPVVFLCDTARRFNKQDSQDTVLVHPQLGLGPKLTDTARHVEYPTIARHAIRLRLNKELMSEELRLLYVALTRGKERLFVTAAFKNVEEKIAALRGDVSVPMAPEVLRSASSMAVWMMYACLGNEEDKFKMTVCHVGEEESAPEKTEKEALLPDEEGERRIEKNLSFKYAYDFAVALPSKVTATELKGMPSEDEEAESLAPKSELSFNMPDFAKGDEPVTGAERGIATHLTLQNIDFAKTGSREEIASEIARLTQARFLSDREAAGVDIGAIEKLFASPLGKRMLSADELLREFKFSLLWDADRVYPTTAGETLLMQGVVDCCIREGEELTVIDYKTDLVRSAEEIAGRAELYRGQVAAYAAALERICGKKVREGVLYFLAAGREITVYRGSAQENKK